MNALYVYLTIISVTSTWGLNGHIFKCANQDEIDEWFVCDTIDDCTDGSDENVLMCKMREYVSKGEFRCRNGRCISSGNVCDGKMQCPQGDDEEPKMCRDYTCPIGKFKCNSNECIHVDVLCDGHKNCHDGSDEYNEMCKVLS